jgi:hypothetical protein
MGDASGPVSVRVLAQGKSVVFGELFFEEPCNKAPSNLIRVGIVRSLFKEDRPGDRLGVELGVRVHGTKSHGLAMGIEAHCNSIAQEVEKGQKMF